MPQFASTIKIYQSITLQLFRVQRRNYRPTRANPSHQQRDAFLGRLHRLYGNQGIPTAKGDIESCKACKKKLASLLRPYAGESFIITQEIKDIVIQYTGIMQWSWGDETRPSDFIHNVCRSMGPCNFPSDSEMV